MFLLNLQDMSYVENKQNVKNTLREKDVDFQ